MPAEVSVNNGNGTIVEIAHHKHGMVQICAEQHRVAQHPVPLELSFPRRQTQMTVEYMDDTFRLNLKIDPKAAPRFAPGCITEIVLFAPDQGKRSQYRHTKCAAFDTSSRAKESIERKGVRKMLRLVHITAPPHPAIEFLKCRYIRFFTFENFPDTVEIISTIDAKARMDVVRQYFQPPSEHLSNGLDAHTKQTPCFVATLRQTVKITVEVIICLMYSLGPFPTSIVVGCSIENAFMEDAMERRHVDVTRAMRFVLDATPLEPWEEAHLLFCHQ
jgi:hypothetical protein